MSDELTPEEKEAFNSLPRERMPVGLETRVVDAMRDHGFLAKRRRVIQLTNTRVAGVLAAGVALVIGAYSIGLHRGEGEDALRAVAPTSTQMPGSGAPTEFDELAVQTPPVNETVPESEPLELRDAPQSKDLQKERTRANEARETVDADADAPEGVASAPPVRSDEVKKDLDWRLKPKEEERSEAQKSVASDAVAPQSEAAGAPARAVAPQPSTIMEATSRTLTFLLSGKTILVDAPDSVRIVEDKEGKMLLIYTSDGVIRIRVAD